MKSLLLLIDGLGDDPLTLWQNRTPWEQSLRPYMNKISASGKEGKISICQDDIVPESCSCILRLLGVPKDAMPKNRAYLELLANGSDIAEDELVMRCNLVAIDAAGKMTAFNGAGLNNDVMRQAAEQCSNINGDVRFIHLSEYRNLLILPHNEDLLSAWITPPHESVGEVYDELLQDLRKKSKPLDIFLTGAEKELGLFSHAGIKYGLYPWGVSTKDILPSFEDLHGRKGAVVCKAEIVQGIGKALKMCVKVPPGATGDVDTNIKEKAVAAADLLQNNDFVLVHFNGSDEAAHRKDYLSKTAFLERIDREFVAKLFRNFPQLRIVICGDHVTSSLTGKHGRGKVPFIAGIVNGETAVPIIEDYSNIIKFLYTGV